MNNDSYNDLDNTNTNSEIERCAWMAGISAITIENMISVLMSNKEKGRVARLWLEVNKINMAPPSIPPGMGALYYKASYVDKLRAWAAHERNLTINPTSVGLVGIKNAIAVIVSSGMFHVKRY